MPKILVVHNILWAHYKGAVYSELYKRMQLHHHDFFVLQISETERSRTGVGGVDLSIHNYPYKVLFTTTFERLTFLQKAYALVREIRSHSPTVLILPGYFDASFWIALIFAKALGVKVMLTSDSTEADKPRRWYSEAVKRVFVKSCDGGFGYGVKSKEYLRKLGMPEANIFVRTQATLNDQIRALYERAQGDGSVCARARQYSARNFIYVGRLSKEKNIAVLLHAYHEVSRDRDANWGLLIVGDGPERERLVQLRDELKLSKAVFVGGKSWKEIPAYYALSDVLVLPSTSEPWGLVVNEAMICGLPVLVSNRCGAAYDLVYEGRNGFIFNPYDVSELANRMQHFVRNSGEASRMGAESTKIIASYTPEKAAQEMFNGINSVLKAPQ